TIGERLDAERAIAARSRGQGMHGATLLLDRQSEEAVRGIAELVEHRSRHTMPDQREEADIAADPVEPRCQPAPSRGIAIACFREIDDGNGSGHEDASSSD